MLAFLSLIYYLSLITVSSQILPLLSFKQTSSVDPTAQGGTLNKSIKNETILTFEVSQFDPKKNASFVCLRAQFALYLELLNVPIENRSQKSNFNQSMTAKTKLSEKYSTCDTLLLNFEHDGSDDNSNLDLPTLKLKFSIEQSEKNDNDVEIFYLQNLQAEHLDFEGHKAGTVIPFAKEGTPLPDDEERDQFTPIGLRGSRVLKSKLILF